MKKKKGFTLVELLAVIAILAIILLIAVPTILGVIDNAKKDSFRNSVRGMIKAVELKNAQTGIMSGNISDLDLSVKGFGGSWSITNGEVKLSKVCNQEYCISGEVTSKNMGSNFDLVKSDGNIDNPGVLYSNILDKAKTLVYNNNTCKTDGSTYNYMNGCYIKGNPNNNYVWFNGFLWRIMGINEDKTVKLIAQENVATFNYHASDSNWETSQAKKWLNEYFLSNTNQELNKKIVAKIWCSDTSIDSASVRTTCSSGKETTSSKVGLLTLDEYNLAGGTNSYLKMGQSSRTMTAYSDSRTWLVSIDGSAINGRVDSADGEVPVINVAADTIITSGNGTLSLVDGKHDYYVMGEEKSNTTNTSLVNKVTSGDYVKFANKIYRVVSKNATEVKLKLDGFYEETAGTIYNIKYGIDNIFTIENRNTSDATLQGIGYKLNIDVLNWLVPTSDATNRNKLVVNKEWYRGSYAEGNDYSTTSMKEDSTTKVTEDITVGLIRIGEMLSGQSASILTKNYTVASDYTNAKTYWGFTPHASATNAWRVNSGGNAYYYDVAITRGVLPVIKVRSNITIICGNGTLATPYEI